ncbi:MAG TPA: ROK family protein [Candidatus Limnocylindrales bacterium]|nr:ROK family protein [Candidatus Limnocylindrales bacterium]
MTSVRTEPGLRSETIRRANLGAILRELHAGGPTSRSGLVASTGLTRSAIRGLIGELVAGGLVAEGRATRLGTPGRPSPLVYPRPEGAVVLALDVEVDSLGAALIGLGGRVLEHVRVDRRRGHSTLVAIVDDLAELAATIRARRAAPDHLIGIGVAVAGVVRRADGLVSRAPNLGWSDQPLGDQLVRVLGDDLPVTIANEAELGALAEARRGVAVGADHVLFVTGEVGVGGGLVIDGAPFTGVAGYGGEVGHMPINPDGDVCSCGSTGCWETEVGGLRLLRRAGHAATNGRAEMDSLLRDAAAGDERTLAALAETGRWLGIGLAGLVNVLNPRLVVFGGLFERIHPYVAAIVDAELDRRALPASRRLARVVAGSLGAEAALIGAAELAFEPVLADPAAWIRRADDDVSRTPKQAVRRVVA